MASKFLVTTTSLVARLKYKTEQNVMSHCDVQKVDAIFSDALVTTTKTVNGYPMKLVYMTRKRGGLAMPLFSDRAAVGKTIKLFSCLRSHQQQAHAAGGTISRLAREHKYYVIRGQGIIIMPVMPNMRDRKLFCDGPAEWLQ